MRRPFTDHRSAALAILTTSDLTEKEGQFCGNIAFRHEPLTDRQAKWLRILLDRNGLPPLVEGGAHA
jgi:hypothetical protein